MFWILMSILVVAAALLIGRRRRSYREPAEPWAAQERDDAPLDIDDIRKAESEWLAQEGWSASEDGEEWR